MKDELTMKDESKSKAEYSKDLEKLHKKIAELEDSKKELSKAKIKAEESDRAKSTFLVNMSHEIRTPMNAILGFAELLKEPDFDEVKKAQFLDVINIKCKHLITIIDDLIDISRIESNQIKLASKECSLNTLLDELYSMYLTEAAMLNKSHITLHVQKALNDEDCRINTDEPRLMQILSNLISNALKYSEDGYVEFGYSVKNPNTLQFYVKDTGIGIPKDKHKIIFERFNQPDNDYTRQFGGIGLGLAICKRLVELMKGKIWVESEGGEQSENLPVLSVIRPDGKEGIPGKGSTFYFNIPYKPS